MPAVEILRVTRAVAHLVRVGKWEQIYSAMEIGRSDGMQSFEQSLSELVKKGFVDERDAFGATRDAGLFQEWLNS